MAVNDVVTPVLARLVRGEELTADEIDAAIGEILDGRVGEVQAAGFLTALRTKGETDSELAALVAAMPAMGQGVSLSFVGRAISSDGNGK